MPTLLRPHVSPRGGSTEKSAENHGTREARGFRGVPPGDQPRLWGEVEPRSALKLLRKFVMRLLFF